MKSVLFIAVMSLVLSGFSAFADEDVDNHVQDSHRIPVPTGKYITGGVLASTVGFGIGHGIQGRYQDKGWIFTATEAASLTVLIAGASSCASTTYTNSSGNSTCSSGGGVALVGLAAYIGFHVWEIVDAWTGARPVDDNERKASAFVNPDPKSPGLGVAFSF
jgi:hypothetical protein